MVVVQKPFVRLAVLTPVDAAKDVEPFGEFSLVCRVVGR
jgi:hypothetical protein